MLFFGNQGFQSMTCLAGSGLRRGKPFSFTANLSTYICVMLFLSVLRLRTDDQARFKEQSRSTTTTSSVGVRHGRILPFFDHDFCPRDLNVMNLRYHHFEFDLSCVELRNMYSISLSCVKKTSNCKRA